VKIISQVSPLNQDEINYLSRHLADVNSKPLLIKRSMIDAIKSFCRKPLVDFLLYMVGTLVFFTVIGAIALSVGLYLAGYYN
jgi:hypothetical protein